MRNVYKNVLSGLAGLLLLISFSAQAYEESHWTDDIDAELGLGVAVFPWFMGSNEYRVLPLPVVDVSYKKFLFASSQQGVGIRTMLVDNLIVGARFLYDYGRPQHGHIKDMKNLAGSIDAGVFARYLMLPWYITGDIQTALTDQGHSGTYGTVGGGYIYEINYNWELNSRATMTFANHRYMDAYFGVDQGDANKTGFAVYDPDGGFRDVSVATVLSYYGIEHWRIFGSVGASVLGKEAGDSDVVQEQLQWRFFLGASYKF